MIDIGFAQVRRLMAASTGIEAQAAWLVTDVRAEVADLRSRGAKIEEYDMPGLKTPDGIADVGFAWAAWIIDPGKNALGILQLRNKGSLLCYFGYRR